MYGPIAAKTTKNKLVLKNITISICNAFFKGFVHLSISCTNSIQEKCSGTVQEMSRSCLGMVQKHVLDEFILKKCRAVMEISWTLPGELLWTFPEQFPNAFPGRN